ncbi:MAG: AI-2E family transporter [Eubacteriales bacterium]|nr:AI-2E family transporter [Eubacteriales bacterium]
MENNSNFFSKERRAKIISIIVLSLLLITVWNMLDLVLMTFVLCFVFYVATKKIKDFFLEMGIRIPIAGTLALLYVIFITLVVVGIGLFIPSAIARVTEIVNVIIKFDWAAFNDALSPRLSRALTVIDMSPYISEVTVYLTKFMTDLSTIIAHMAITLSLAILLSFLILLERNKIALFGEYLAKSQISDFYTYFVSFGQNFCATFGKVMKVQLTIAFVNCVLSVFAFKFIGLPDVIALGIMIFFLGLIPVAGVIISLIPLSAIAFNTGGIVMVIEVLATIAVLHAVEAYLLNPKLMANKTQLPVCFVFSILLVGEHYMGVWGLLIGVPIFIFMMDALGVKYEQGMREQKQKKKIPRQRNKRLKKI